MKKIYFFAIVFQFTSEVFSQHSDTQTAQLLCDQTNRTLQTLAGGGNQTTEVANLACYPQVYPETNSAWLKWEMAGGGSLGFTILPFAAADDIDFVLYRLPNGVGDCSVKTPVRCMVAGQVLGETKPLGQACTGATGLRTTSDGDGEKVGCRANSDNFLASVETLEGEAYLLFINNYHSANGVSVRFSGNSVFRAFPDACGAGAGSGGATSEVAGVAAADQLRFSAAYPNPTNSEVNINAFSSIAQGGTYQVISASGQIVETQPFVLHEGDNPIKIQVAQLVSGVYFVKFVCGSALHIARFTR
jgi:Secretion system C-terminal sorting domain